MIWVVDSNDKQRLEDCKAELFSILQEEVCQALNPTLHALTDLHTARNCVETGRCKLAHLRQQARHTGSTHDRRAVQSKPDALYYVLKCEADVLSRPWI